MTTVERDQIHAAHQQLKTAEEHLENVTKVKDLGGQMWSQAYSHLQGARDRYKQLLDGLVGAEPKLEDSFIGGLVAETLGS